VPPGCVTDPNPGVASPVQHSPMSPVIVVGPVFVIVEPASSANESAVASDTGDAAEALLLTSAANATASMRACKNPRRELGARWSCPTMCDPFELRPPTVAMVMTPQRCALGLRTTT
jgi:hypothetical protein